MKNEAHKVNKGTERIGLKCPKTSTRFYKDKHYDFMMMIAKSIGKKSNFTFFSLILYSDGFQTHRYKELTLMLVLTT
jgi:hypothetical protein